MISLFLKLYLIFLLSKPRESRPWIFLRALERLRTFFFFFIYLSFFLLNNVLKSSLSWRTRWERDRTNTNKKATTTTKVESKTTETDSIRWLMDDATGFCSISKIRTIFLNWDLWDFSVESDKKKGKSREQCSWNDVKANQVQLGNPKPRLAESKTRFRFIRTTRDNLIP